MVKKRVACIVDGHSTGAELAGALKELDWFIVHVQARKEISPSYIKSFNPTLFDVLLHASNLTREDLVMTVQAYRPEFVIAGSEPGIELADLLSASLGLSGNDPQTSAKRRNKYLMAQAISEQGLSCARQYLVSSEQELLDATTKINSRAVVVKPVDAMGSEDVRICFEEHEALAAFRTIFGKKNVVGIVNDSVLVQEFIEGEQYVVNGVSIGGKHRITELWHEQRLNIRGVGNLYDYETMIPYEGSSQALIIEYTKKVLTALGIEEGASHTEIILTKEGPVLIECGARMQGGIISAPILEAIGDSHMTMTLKRYVDPLNFLENINTRYVMTKTLRVVNLIMARAGVVKENNSNVLLVTLPSFCMIARTPDVGDYVKKTTDLPTKVGHVYLMHDSMLQLDSDYKKIREWEAAGHLIVLH